MKRRVILAVGGTGGHLFPAQQLAEKMKNQGFDILFIGKGLTSSKFFKKDIFRFYDVSSSTFILKNPLKVLFGSISIIRGVFSSIKFIISYKPDIIIGFGSYYSLPVLLAGVLLRKKIILHEQNVIPGKVNTLFSRYAKAIGLTFPDIYNILKCKEKSIVSLEKSDFAFSNTSFFSKDFYENRKILLVFGGSLGSLAINNIFLNSLPLVLKEKSNLSVIHIIGENENINNIRNIYLKLKIPSIVKTFEKNINFYFEKASLAICRAGAGTLKELIDYELPAIMIPYPYAYNHQEKNALFFQEEVKGGIFIKEDIYSHEKLVEAILKLLDSDQLLIYKKNLSRYKNSCKKQDFVNFIVSVLS